MNDIEYLNKYLNSKDMKKALEELKKGIPVQYIVGSVDFYGNKIEVNSDVLIPRFETEELVSRTIKLIKKKFNNKVDIIDLGTGSGCIAITLKKYIDCNMDAVDISDSALKIASSNALNNKVDINFINNDMLNNINKKYDIIISNPPYISYDEEIMEIVKNNEPAIALYASNKGLYFYEKILKTIEKNLKNKYLIAFEIGYLQGEDIINLINKYLPFSNIKLEQDLQGKDRFIFIEGELCD